MLPFSASTRTDPTLQVLPNAELYAHVISIRRGSHSNTRDFSQALRDPAPMARRGAEEEVGVGHGSTDTD